jgi:hypothetical protein
MVRPPSVPAESVLTWSTAFVAVPASKASDTSPGRTWTAYAPFPSVVATDVASPPDVAVTMVPAAAPAASVTMPWSSTVADPSTSVSVTSVGSVEISTSAWVVREG